MPDFRYWFRPGELPRDVARWTVVFGLIGLVLTIGFALAAVLNTEAFFTSFCNLVGFDLDAGENRGHSGGANALIVAVIFFGLCVLIFGLAFVISCAFTISGLIALATNKGPPPVPTDEYDDEEDHEDDDLT